MKSPPWFRLIAADWQAAAQDLAAVERGILISLLVALHQRGEPIPEDYHRLATVTGADRRTVMRTVELLLVDGRLSRKDGGLWSQLIEAEIAHRKNVSEVRSKNASERWKKTKQNQHSSDANAYRDSESRDSEGDAWRPHFTETSSSTLEESGHSAALNDVDDARIERAPDTKRTRPLYRKGVLINHPKLGKCRVLDVYPEDRRVKVLQLRTGKEGVFGVRPEVRFSQAESERAA